MVCSYSPTQKERLERCGYSFVHLFSSVYLVRNYSTYAREFSFYGIAVLRKGELIMDNCRQACPYNTLDGCKVKEYNAICPLTNIATPITEYRITNADRIRAMSDEELARFFADKIENEYILSQKRLGYSEHTLTASQIEAIRHNCYCIWMRWLKQPADMRGEEE